MVTLLDRDALGFGWTPSVVGHAWVGKVAVVFIFAIQTVFVSVTHITHQDTRLAVALEFRLRVALLRFSWAGHFVRTVLAIYFLVTALEI